MSRVRPWEVWLVDFGDAVGSEQGGRRPAVVVASEFHARFPIPITLAVPLTTRDRGLPHHIAVEPGGSGVRNRCFARTEEITAISERRLVGNQPLGTLDERTEWCMFPTPSTRTRTVSGAPMLSCVRTWARMGRATLPRRLSMTSAKRSPG